MRIVPERPTLTKGARGRARIRGASVLVYIILLALVLGVAFAMGWLPRARQARAVVAAACGSGDAVLLDGRDPRRGQGLATLRGAHGAVVKLNPLPNAHWP